MTELVRINTQITRAAFERIKDEIERRNGEMALKATIGNIVVRLAMGHLPESNWEEQEQLHPSGKPAQRKPPRAAAAAAKPARRRPAKADAATRAAADKAQGAGGN